MRRRPCSYCGEVGHTQSDCIDWLRDEYSRLSREAKERDAEAAANRQVISRGWGNPLMVAERRLNERLRTVNSHQTTPGRLTLTIRN